MDIYTVKFIIEHTISHKLTVSLSELECSVRMYISFIYIAQYINFELIGTLNL